MSDDFIAAGVNLEFRYAAGETASRFLAALRDERKIYGTRCPQCQRVLVPARGFCPRCGVDTAVWLQVGPTGTLVAAAPPFGLIRLDGADTNLVHRLDGAPLDAWQVGMRVEAVFATGRTGSINDIAHFCPA
ncbi:MAG: Zn-ribbon domain-containing OB-fold protein [Anaerolineae bacterium]